MIRVYDAYGREMFITKDHWRTSVLPGAIKSNWNDPEKLYGVIVGSFNDGFFADILEAAKQLYHLEPVSARAACVYGIALMKCDRLDEAERIFQSYTEKHGEEASVLTNLARVYSARNDPQQVERTLWRAVEIDPNQDNGVGWYVAIHRERGGQTAANEALRKIAALPGSWRAELWLAREALSNRNLEEALALYQRCLARTVKPPPTDLLMQMSGDLGNAGHIPEILQLVEPHFDATSHGLLVGNNLIKAHITLGQIDAARQILDQLHALNRVDWKQSLSFWENEIAKARVASAPVDQDRPLKLAMLTGEGPVWLKPSSPAAELFPAKPPDAVVVSFLGSSADAQTNSGRIERQMADAQGRISRALPLFLSEQVEFNTDARVQTLVPWIAEADGGFVLAGSPWKDEDAANYSRQRATKADYVVVTHLKPHAQPWTVELRLIRSIDCECLGNLSVSFPPAEPQQGIPGLVQQLLALLAENAQVRLQAPAQIYQAPGGANFPYYLLRLEQLLAVRCSGIEGIRPDFLSGERDIIDGNLQLCLACPDNACTRILLAQTLQAMKRVRPDILPAFKEKMILLQKEKPLLQPAHGVVQRMFDEAFAS